MLPPKMQNIICTADLQQHIDARKFNNFPWGRYDTKEETKIVGWKTKTSSEKNLSIAIYDILTENKYPEDKVEKITPKIIELAKRNLP